MQELEPRAGDELDRLIGRYARVRLDPKPSEARRARTAVMEQAWRRRLAPEVAASMASATSRDTRRRRGPLTSWGGRRLGSALAAAVVAGLMLGSTAFAASRAGGPLYDARLSLEALTLPGEPNARLDADLARAQTRIAEIAEAASRGDDGAVNAAVRAYAMTLADLDASTGDSAGRARDAVIAHLDVLRNLLLRVPVQAQGGIERAITNSTVAIDHLDKASANPAATPAGPPDGNPNAGAGEPNAGGGNPNAGGGDPNAGGGDPNAGGGDPNAGGGNPNAGGGDNGGAGGGGNGGGGDNGGGNANGGGENGGAGGGGNRNGTGANGNDAGAGAGDGGDRTPKPEHSKKPNKAEPTPSD